MALFSLSGGLLYHLKAIRYSRELWAPFRRHVATWLNDALPPESELVLVGPSAGHCLPLEQLARFERVYVLEPDPIARRILAWRLAHPRLHVEHRDLLVEPLISGRAGLDALLDRRPNAAVLFCDLLGQVQLELGEEQQSRFQREFRRRILPRLAGRRWASFHDRWSLDRGLEEPKLPSVVGFNYVPQDEELGAAWFGAGSAAVQVLDHATSELFPEPGSRRYFAWQITPHALHIVEAVSG
jgi:hypothetical protein